MKFFQQIPQETVLGTAQVQHKSQALPKDSIYSIDPASRSATYLVPGAGLEPARGVASGDFK